MAPFVLVGTDCQWIGSGSVILLPGLPQTLVWALNPVHYPLPDS